MKPLQGKVAVVAGATRGAGRGIACMLGEARATVYCTGRSVRGSPNMIGYFAGRPETIEETAEMVTGRGGVGMPVQVDYNVEDQVRALFSRVKDEQARLDVLVNNFWGGPSVEFTEFGKPFWELSLEKGRLLQQHINSHLMTSSYAAPLMVERSQGLIVEIIDGDNFGYRAHLFYDLVLASVIRFTYAMARDLRKHNVTALAVTPGYMRTEAILDGFGVTEANWWEGAKKDPNFIASETPFYVGRAVAALASDPQVSKKSGRVFSSSGLAQEYGFPDIDGRQPNIDKHFVESNFLNHRRVKKCDDAFYAYWVGLFDEA
jgi:NAD(P)-dependent dehydrogenase (short-subunit alcohol dehydrogenase family)